MKVIFRPCNVRFRWIPENLNRDFPDQPSTWHWLFFSFWFDDKER